MMIISFPLMVSIKNPVSDRPLTESFFEAKRILYLTGETTPDLTVFFSNGGRLLPWGLGGRP